MPLHNENLKSVKSSLFVDYKPAELKIGSQWLVVYYAKNPISKKLERFRVSVPVIASKTERTKHGKRIVAEINRKLEGGWLPFYSDVSSDDFKTFEYCKDKFLGWLTINIEKGMLRPDTERAYKSYFSMIEFYVKLKKLNFKFLFEMNRVFIINYLDYILYERNNSPRTFNNHLGFIVGFQNFCISRGFLKENQAIAIQKKKENEKVRQLLSVSVKEKIKLLKKDDFHYFVLCMTTYFCLIRRTELTKLLVADVEMIRNTISVPVSTSKKSQQIDIVTIPDKLLPLFAKHLEKANLNDYLFSANNFMPGKEQLQPKKISDTWEKYRTKYGIPNQFQFYSLKDTGITDLLNSGVPSLRVKNQARHAQLSTTEKYTHRNKNSDEVIRKINFDF